jgi:hypothetical protein
MTASRGPGRTSLRAGLRRVATGLIAYGIVGLVVAVIGLGALVWVNGRMESVASSADVTVVRLTDSLDNAAVALADAGASATSFAGTLDRTTVTVEDAAETLRAVRPQLAALEAQFRSINILGQQPFGKAADVVSGISPALEGLDGRLDDIASSLTENRAKLTANAASLSATGASIAALSDLLKGGVVTTGVDDVRAVILVTLLLLVAWTAVPAVGALGFGIWLRRELGSAP